MALLPKFIKKIMARFGIEIHRLYYIECDLSQKLEPVQAKIPITIKRATPATLKKALPLLDEATRKVISESIDRDDVRILAYAGSELAGISCYSKHHIYVHNRQIAALDGGGYGHSSYVLPKFRGKKIFQALIYAGYAQQQKDGNRFASNCVSVGNGPALGARLRFGIKKKQVLVILWNQRSWVIGRPIGNGCLIGNSK